jgi:hypothetical protein
MWWQGRLPGVEIPERRPGERLIIAETEVWGPDSSGL